MKTTIKLFIVLIIGAITFSSCNKGIAFNQRVQDKYSLTKQDIPNMQFFVSSDIMLERSEKIVPKKRFDSHGKLIVNTYSSMNLIKIDAKTPGVCVKVYGDRKLAITFFDDESKQLIFGDPDNIGKYKLLAESWENGKGKIKLGGITYHIRPGGSKAYLKFKISRVDTEDTVIQSAKGRKVYKD